MSELDRELLVCEFDAVGDRELLRAMRDEQTPRSRGGEHSLGFGHGEMAARLRLAAGQRRLAEEEG